jgi:hypothetical protein
MPNEPNDSCSWKNLPSDRKFITKPNAFMLDNNYYRIVKVNDKILRVCFDTDYLFNYFAVLLKPFKDDNTSIIKIRDIFDTILMVNNDESKI